MILAPGLGPRCTSHTHTDLTAGGPRSHVSSEALRQCSGSPHQLRSHQEENCLKLKYILQQDYNYRCKADWHLKPHTTLLKQINRAGFHCAHSSHILLFYRWKKEHPATSWDISEVTVLPSRVWRGLTHAYTIHSLFPASKNNLLLNGIGFCMWTTLSCGSGGVAQRGNCPTSTDELWLLERMTELHLENSQNQGCLCNTSC